MAINANTCNCYVYSAYILLVHGFVLVINKHTILSEALVNLALSLVPERDLVLSAIKYTLSYNYRIPKTFFQLSYLYIQLNLFTCCYDMYYIFSR